ncbi:hypothetical protein GNY06_05085 [Elizabethkingia argentiflava]|uniref:Uncharacterized protein n=1 Tax=Elizabethkingia argenteiflava TaxID=2681556 RepID=A0A845PRF2_9FLAO|nr:hypothetical protein [Elizabethkingia argenteiflava]NAW50782.1 hypothetical protein [Elizabethkingia argenteiflava]
MACNCSHPLKQDDCERIREHARDGRSFIFHLFSDGVLSIAQVKKGENPNEIAEKQGFFNQEGQLEWFSVNEHPCAHETL